MYSAGDAIRDCVDPGWAVCPKAMGGNAMTHDAHQKVKASHLKRNAYLYVRQSTLRQVFENTESTQRQYALRHAAPTVAGQFQSDPLDFVAPINVGVFRRRRVLQASSQK